jgi:methylphosphotriester-DNA--protein-cysteine methyltransferase
MMRHLFAVGCVVALACSGAAQEPKLVQPPKADTAVRLRAEAAKRAAEEIESLEAHFHTKKAYIQAAQVAVQAAARAVERASKAAEAKIASQEMVDEAKLGLEAAKAQLTIREAEANEVAVKIKHAKRRAEDNQKAEAREDADRARMKELARSITESDLTQAKAKLELANAELTRLEELVKRGIVAKADFDAARVKQEAAKATVELLTKQVELLKHPVGPDKDLLKP